MTTRLYGLLALIGAEAYRLLLPKFFSPERMAGMSVSVQAEAEASMFMGEAICFTILIGAAAAIIFPDLYGRKEAI